MFCFVLHNDRHGTFLIFVQADTQSVSTIYWMVAFYFQYMLFITFVNNYVFIAVWDYLLVPYYVSFSTYALRDNYYSFLPLWFGAMILGNMIPLAVSTLRNTLIVWALLCYNVNVRITFCSTDFLHLLRLRNPKQKLWLVWFLPWPSFWLVKHHSPPHKMKGKFSMSSFSLMKGI